MDFLPVIVDCDPGIDDIEAILLCLKSKKIRILAITLVAGNGSMKQIKLNIGKVLKFLDLLEEIPVYESFTHNSNGDEIESHPHFGPDSIGNLDIPEYVINFSNKKSPQALVDLIMEYKNEVTILAIGPLTNLNLAYNINPSIVDHIKDTIIMGGNEYKNVHENVTPYAEFNCWIDPVAFDFVIKNFSKIKPVKLVTWNSTLRNPIDQMCISINRQKLSKLLNRSKIGELYNLMTSNKEYGPLKATNNNLYITADPLTAFWLLHPNDVLQTRLGYFKTESFHGTTKGQTTVTFDLEDSNLIPNVEVAIYFNMAKFTELLNSLFT